MDVYRLCMAVQYKFTIDYKVWLGITCEALWLPYAGRRLQQICFAG
jgi:hypothetical protein